MGVMIEGQWTTDEKAFALTSADDRFRRTPSVIRHWITPDGGSDRAKARDADQGKRGRWQISSAEYR